MTISVGRKTEKR